MKASEVAEARAILVERQGNLCAICHGKFYPEKMPLDPVLDHCHKTGKLRGAVHRGCNTLLGRIENGAARAWVKLPALPEWLAGCAEYLAAASPKKGLLHPTFRTAEEKVVRTKVRAKKRRVAKKAKA
jgi:Recombination endonuclease VII